jgi:hypothetical protein
MSYDLQLFDIDPRANLEEVLQAREQELVAKHRDMLNAQYVLPALHQRMAEELADQYIVLDRVDADSGFVELTHEQYGIQISIFDTEIAVTVPYWHQGKKARLVWEEIWRYLTLIEAETGYHTVDPQVGRVLDLSSDLPAVLSAYAEAMRRTSR